MFKTAAIAIVLAATLATSSAASAAGGPGTWTFTYTGFYNQNAGVFDSAYQLAGSFTGSDANSDGFIGRNEITAFNLGGTNYVACAGDSNDYYSCGVETFNYKVGGKLEFYAAVSGNDPEGQAGGGHYINAGVGEFDYRYTPYSYDESANLWTADTRFQISPEMKSGGGVPAVPEPGTWAMLATGLLLVGATAARRRGQPAAR